METAKRFTTPIRQSSSISILESVVLGGLEQWVLIRGENINNPAILFLHGGPGQAQIGWAPYYQSLLERDFVVINWDQRGSGLSYSETMPSEAMSIKQFVQDAYELTNYVLNRLNKQKIYLVGHSWGTVIGTYLVEKFPDLFHAYVGVGQCVDFQRGELLSYQYTLDYAKANNVQDALQELTEIGPPPYKDMFNGLFTQRKWLSVFGGLLIKDKELFSDIDQIMHDRPEYNEEDVERRKAGNQFSVKTMWPEILTVNLLSQVKSVKVPVYFLMGKHDYNTPNELVKEFYESLHAPLKELIIFDDVAHLLPFEDPDSFYKTMCQIAKLRISL